MNKLKPKILFVIPTLRAGGAERVMSFLAQSINKQLFDPTLIVIGFEKDKSYSVENTNIVYLNKTRVAKAIYPLFRLIVENKPAIIISSIGHLNILMGFFSLFISKTKFIARESSVISIRKKYGKKKLGVPIQLVKLIYKRLDAIICQSNDMAIDIHRVYNIPKQKTVIINNPISIDFPLKTPKNLDHKVFSFITVGRLNSVKGHSRILSVLSSFNKPFHYTIIGDGPEKISILTKAEKLGINNYISYIKHTHEIGKYLTQNDFFLQGSYVEGFPNALLESCAVGTPVIAFSAPGGTKEIIEDKINGFLVDDEEDFIKKLNIALTMYWDPQIVSESVFKKLNEKRITKQYEDLFNRLLQA